MLVTLIKYCKYLYWVELLFIGWREHVALLKNTNLKFFFGIGLSLIIKVNMSDPLFKVGPSLFFFLKLDLRSRHTSLYLTLFLSLGPCTSSPAGYARIAVSRHQFVVTKKVGRTTE